MSSEFTPEDNWVAIIGMAGRFPGAKSIDEFWKNLLANVEAVEPLSDELLLKNGVASEYLTNRNYVKVAIELEDKSLFDARFFGFSAKEASLLDPQQRLLLETAYHALEHAGYSPENSGLCTGVFVGTDISSYLISNIASSNMIDFDPIQITYSNSSVATQIAYRLNLKGPCMDINTACSTSLVSVHAACRSLLFYDCDLAIAGGASINAHPIQGYLYHPEGILSPDGHCRPFDDNAQGTVPGQGVALVVLKRLGDALADNDQIYAVIRGSYVNNDGSNKVGYTAPSVDGQIDVIKRALFFAETSAKDISYVECHGTGTIIGDPIELTALQEVYGCSEAENPCYFGSVKGNIGHLNSAAGIAGLIKTVLSLKYHVIPSTVNFKKLNSKIDLSCSRLRITDNPQSIIKQDSFCAAVSSFGIGGTNAHVVLSSYPRTETCSDESMVLKPLFISAKTPKALRKKCQDMISYLSDPSLQTNLSDILYSLNSGRTPYKYRYAHLVSDKNHVISILTSAMQQPVKLVGDEKKKIVFVVSGQGIKLCKQSKYLYDGRTIFTKKLDYCAQLIKKRMGFDIISFLYAGSELNLEAGAERRQTAIMQLSVFAFNYALASWWIAIGLRPDFVCGHSLGEYVAACIANIFSIENAIEIVCLRAELMQTLPLGGMLAVNLNDAATRELIDENCSVAAINSDKITVISGSIDSIEHAQIFLTENKIAFYRLPVEVAFHSGVMDRISEKFEKGISQYDFCAPEIPFVSTICHGRTTDFEVASSKYWTAHLCATVQFKELISTLAKDEAKIFIEIGADPTLTRLIENQISLPHVALPSFDNRQNLGMPDISPLIMLGHTINWSAFYDNRFNYNKVNLPVYPFESKHYWISEFRGLLNRNTEAHGDDDSKCLQREELIGPENRLESELAEIWSEVLGVKHIGMLDSFFELGGHSLLAVQIIARVKAKYDIDLSIENIISNPTIRQVCNLVLKEQFKTLSISEVPYVLDNTQEAS